MNYIKSLCNTRSLASSIISRSLRYLKFVQYINIGLNLYSDITLPTTQPPPLFTLSGDFLLHKNCIFSKKKSRTEYLVPNGGRKRGQEISVAMSLGRPKFILRLTSLRNTKPTREGHKTQNIQTNDFCSLTSIQIQLVFKLHV